jgi:hypothetical protein
MVYRVTIFRDTIFRDTIYRDTIYRDTIYGVTDHVTSLLVPNHISHTESSVPPLEMCELWKIDLRRDLEHIKQRHGSPCTVLYSTVLYSTVYNAVQYSTVQSPFAAV